VDSSLLLTPISDKDFFANYWESQPLLVSRADSLHFSGLLSVDGIKEYVGENAVCFPDVQVVNARSSVPVESYTDNSDRQINSELLFKHYAQGATVIVSAVHQKFPSVGELCRNVNMGMQLRCQANAYLSPPGNQGFHSHYDTHDVFVVQVSGRKTFRFYPSDIELPFTDDTFHPDNHTEGDVSEQVELSAGDTLYIPRGMVHDALADEGEPSLHITLGVFPFVARDLIQEMIQVAAEQNVSIRKSINLNLPDTKHSAQVTLDSLEELAEVIFTREVLAEARSRLTDEVAMDCIQNSLDTASTDTELELASVVTVNQSVVHSTEHRDGLFKLRLAGRVIQFTEPMDVAVAALLDLQTMNVDSLPGLNAEQRLALCQQLLALGVISIR